MKRLFMVIVASSSSYFSGATYVGSQVNVCSADPIHKQRRRRRTDKYNHQRYERDECSTYFEVENDDDMNDHISRSRIRPRHVAFVLDGNGRWAQKRNLPISAGHAKGAENVVSTVRYILTNYPWMECCTLYAFSTENWSRSSREVRNLWSTVERTATEFMAPWVRENGVRFRIIGDLDDGRIPSTAVKALENLCALSSGSSKRDAKITENAHSGFKKNEMISKSLPSTQRSFTVALALNYGGRQDILSAAKKMFEQQQKIGLSSPQHEDASTTKTYDESTPVLSIEFDEATFSSFLSTSGLPPVDMVVRTGGERRMSNFLLWDAAYAELYFSDVLWPDFAETDLADALEWYSNRDRRYGGRYANLE